MCVRAHWGLGGGGAGPGVSRCARRGLMGDVKVDTLAFTFRGQGLVHSPWQVAALFAGSM